MTTKSETAAKGKGKTDGLHKQVQPSEALSAIVGAKPLTRAEVTSKLWDYIKKNSLQHPDDGRQIKADDKLQPIFGQKQISMFEMNKRVSEHLK